MMFVERMFCQDLAAIGWREVAKCFTCPRGGGETITSQLKQLEIAVRFNASN
jgi:hypothetical protein